jgi:protein-tyrosine phosphatase
MIDIHTHILPQLDDGSPDIETSLEMARQASQQGVTTLIATPHYWPGVYQPRWGEVLEKTSQLNNELANQGINVKVLPGMEVRLDMDLPKWLEQGTIGTLNNTGKHLLVELPHQSLPSYTEMVLCKLLAKGITPILAHPERNQAVIADPNQLYDMLEKGVLVQITAASLIGAFGRRAQHTAKLMLEHGWVHFIASDCHDIVKRRYIYQEVVAADKTKALVQANPLKVLEGKQIALGELKPIIITKNKGEKKQGKSSLIKKLLRWLRLCNQ